ncbi:MAG: hypothetical protein HY860_03895 [Chlamydiales bacterium]|nr:hypothetical protein [Chlamydiales bacterium]
MNYIKQNILFFLLVTSSVIAQSIEDKLASFQQEDGVQEEGFSHHLKETNQELMLLKQHLSLSYNKVKFLQEEDATDEEYEVLLNEVNDIKQQINQAESDFHQFVTLQSKIEQEGYGIWDQEEITLSQLIMEYGSSDYLYIIAPEVSNIKISMHSTLPIPRESWSKLLDVLLAQNGVGIKEINPFTRQLFLHKQDLVAVQRIASNPIQLDIASDNERVAYIFSPPVEHLKAAYYFFDRFRDPKKTFVYSVGNKIAIVSLKEEVKKLLTLYDTVWEKGCEKVTKVIPLTRITSEEILKILKAYFGSLADGNRYAMSKGGNELSAHSLKQENSIVLIGTKDVVSRAETIVKETEAQLEDPSEMTVYWYDCHHSDPVDLAQVLDKVYQSLLLYGLEDGNKSSNNNVNVSTRVEVTEENGGPPVFEDPRIINPIAPPLVEPGVIEKQAKPANTNNFIPYPKTGSLMMVVRKDTLPKIKDLLKRLDVPKKMVQIEVLLCEKKLNQHTQSGLNILKLGSAASSQHNTSIVYNASSTTPLKGLFEFFISRAKPNHYLPAYDISYHFLMAQEDMRINAAPSILTVNQTPATISIVEEISINNGAAPIETNSNITFEKSFTREQFGITIVMTPTIHDPDPEHNEDRSSITLETNVTFDTPKSDKDDRPNVNRRHVQNQVRVLDGQTIIIGGLRKKVAEDRMEKIPFLGEIPGIAKLFGTSRMDDQTTEMYIFITPKIISDPKLDLDRIVREELLKRPGDIPEYLQRLLDAKQKKKQRLFDQSFKLIFGNLDAAY